MSETSLYDIHESIGRLGEAVKGLADKIEGNEKRNVTAIEEANKSRKEMYARIETLVERTGRIEAENTAIKRDSEEIRAKIDGMEKVTVKVTEMSTKAEGAGTLGRWLLTVGGWVISAAVSIVGYYTYLTGKPPP